MHSSAAARNSEVSTKLVLLKARARWLREDLKKHRNCQIRLFRGSKYGEFFFHQSSRWSHYQGDE
jgi:hypothetical protein